MKIQGRVLFVSGQLGGGGAERQSLFIINALCQTGSNIHLAMLNSNGSYMPLLSPKCKRYQIKGEFRFSRFVRIASLVILFHKLQPNVIYTNVWGTAYLVSKALKWYRKDVKFIYGVQNKLEAFTRHRRQFRAVLTDPNVTLIMQTNRICADLYRYRKNLINVYVIPNTIDIKSIRSQVTSKESSPANPFTLVHVGSFNRQKRHDRLLKVVKNLKDRGIKFRMDVIGDGPLRAQIEQLAVKLGLQNHIIFRGYQKNVYNFIAQADLMLLTSDWEGMPMVLLESLALGTPIVSTDVEFGPREIVKEGFNGYCIPTEEIDIFADRVVDVLQNKKQFANRALLSVDNFSIYHHIETYQNIMGITP